MALRKPCQSVLSRGLITNHQLPRTRKLEAKFNSKILQVVPHIMLLGCNNMQMLELLAKASMMPMVWRRRSSRIIMKENFMTREKVTNLWRTSSWWAHLVRKLRQTLLPLRKLVVMPSMQTAKTTVLPATISLPKHKDLAQIQRLRLSVVHIWNHQVAQFHRWNPTASN